MAETEVPQIDRLTLPDDATGDDGAQPAVRATIETAEDAARAVDLVLTAKARAARIAQQCDRIANDAINDAARLESFYLPALRAYAEAHPPKRGKTTKLPTGDLAFKHVPGGVRVDDQKAVIAWAEEHAPGLVEYDYEPRKKLNTNAAKDYFETKIVEHLDKLAQFTTTGDMGDVALSMAAVLPPGVVVTQDEERFYIKPPKAKGDDDE